jgi:Calcineurin-like phosphoesterase
MTDEVLLWILSDLHLELTRGWDLPSGDARPRFHVLVVAGDLIPRMERGVKWLSARVPDRPVIYIAGNHEGYGCDIDRTIEKAKEAAAGTSIHVLQNESVRIGDVIFAGATLWTDFDLFADQRLAMRIAGERMNDFRKISLHKYQDRFLPKHALARHIQSRAYLEAEMRKVRPGPLVVVSHHAPHPAHFQMPSRDPLVARHPDRRLPQRPDGADVAEARRRARRAAACGSLDLRPHARIFRRRDRRDARGVEIRRATVLGRHTSARGTIPASIQTSSSRSDGGKSISTNKVRSWSQSS